MQKALRINLLARNQSVKRAQKTKIRKTREAWAEYDQQNLVMQRIRRSYMKEERANRREDWILGPLAPNRDVGRDNGKLGTISADLTSEPELPRSVRASPRGRGYDAIDKSGEGRNKLFKGRTIVGNVVAGDRVVIVHGPQRLRGQIGEVLDVDYEKEELKLKNININDVALPNVMIREPTENDPNPVRFSSLEQPIPIRHVRLVVMDNETGSEVIVSHVHAAEPYMQRTLGSHLPAHTRYITGSEAMSDNGLPIEIPWPDDYIGDEFRSTPVDTGRDAVERGSWIPSVAVGPLGYDIAADADPSDPMSAYTAGYAKDPSAPLNAVRKLALTGFSDINKAADRQARVGKGIMDELRSKYTRSNTRHDDIKWVQRKILEDARSIWWRDRQVLSPEQERLQTLNRQAQEAREEKIRKYTERAEMKRLRNAIKIEPQTETQQVNQDQMEAQDSVPTVDAQQSAVTPTIDEQVQENPFVRPADAPVPVTTPTTTKAEQIKQKARRVTLTLDTAKLVQDMQEVTLNSVYTKPDQKLLKKLVHMDVQRQMGNTGRELRV